VKGVAIAHLEENPKGCDILCSYQLRRVGVGLGGGADLAAAARDTQMPILNITPEDAFEARPSNPSNVRAAVRSSTTARAHERYYF